MSEEEENNASQPPKRPQRVAIDSAHGIRHFDTFGEAIDYLHTLNGRPDNPGDPEDPRA